MRRSVISLFIALGSISVLASAPAHAVVAVAVPGSFVAGYGTTKIIVPQGQTAQFVNADAANHDVASDACTGSPCRPIFSSALIGVGAVAEIRGVSALRPGDYAFHCSAHAATMRGVLTVVAA